jgi:hypothetical protein
MASDIELQESASWAEDLTQDQLHTVLWLLGEFLGRGNAVLGLLGEHLQPLDTQHEFRRAFEKLTKLCHVPSDGARGVNPALPVISDYLRQEFPIGKHTRWAIDLSDADLHTILANIGSFAKEADPVFDLLVRNATKATSRYVFFRASFALKSLVEIARGQRYSVDEYCRRMNEKIFDLERWIKNEPPTGDFDLVLSR